MAEAARMGMVGKRNHGFPVQSVSVFTDGPGGITPVVCLALQRVPWYPTPLTPHRGWQSLFSLHPAITSDPGLSSSVVQRRFRLLSAPSLTGPGSGP